MKALLAGLCAAVLGTPLLPSSVAAKRPATTYRITINRMAYGPVPAHLHVGDTILWVNRDFLRHTATAADKSFNVDLEAGKSARTVLSHAGRIAVGCTFHPGMKTVLIVEP